MSHALFKLQPALRGVCVVFVLDDKWSTESKRVMLCCSESLAAALH